MLWGIGPPRGSDFPKVTFLPACTHGRSFGRLIPSGVPRKHGGPDMCRRFDTRGNGGGAATSLSSERLDLLCRDPRSDPAGGLLIAPAPLQQRVPDMSSREM